LQNRAAIAPCFDVRPQCKSAVIARKRFIETVQIAQRIAEIVECGRIVGIEGNRPADEIGGGGIIAALRAQYAEEMQGVGIVGVPGKDLAIKRVCLLEAALLVQKKSLTQPVRRIGISGARCVLAGRTTTLRSLPVVHAFCPTRFAALLFEKRKCCAIHAPSPEAGPFSLRTRT